MISVSVIVPMYNVHKYILTLLEGLKAQTFLDVEFILVNDGSKDDTYKLVSSWIKTANDQRFSLFNKKNEGVSLARNYGIQHSSGEYIIFVDSDDNFQDNFIENYYHQIKTNKTDFEFFQAIKLNEKNEKIGKINDKIIKNEFVNNEELLTYYSEFKIEAFPFTYISRRRFWSRDSFSSKFSYQEDTLALFKIIVNQNNLLIHLNNSSYYFYRIRSDSAMQQLDMNDYWNAVQINDFLADKIKKNEKLNYLYKLFNAHKASTLMDIIISSIRNQDSQNYCKARSIFLTEFDEFKITKEHYLKRKIQYILIKLNLKQILKVVYKLRG